MLAEVPPQLGQAFKGHAVPETSWPRASKEPVADDPRDRSVRGAVVAHLDGRGADRPESLKAPFRAALGVREDARVRTRVDQNATRCEDPVHLA
jgi:hypothetical protein